MSHRSRPFILLLVVGLVLVLAVPAGAVGRIDGGSRVATAVEVSRQHFGRASTVVVARADSYADALAGAPLAGVGRAPLLFVDHDRVDRSVHDEIARLGATQVLVLGGPDAVSDRVVRVLGGTRIAAGDRWGTAARIARNVAAATGRTREVILVTGTNYADAVAVAGYAAFRQAPVLLTETGGLPGATRSALKDLAPHEVVIVGGPVAVSEGVADQVRGLGIDVTRLAGGTRYETSAAVVRRSLAVGMRSERRIVATGEYFADALAAGPAAGASGHVLALSSGSQVGPAPLEGLGAGCDVDAFTIVGGAASIGDHVADRLAAAEGGDCSGDPAAGGSWRAGSTEQGLERRLAEVRSRSGAGAVVRADDLDRLAYEWSVEMGRRRTLAHNPDLGARACCYVRIAENVGYVRASDGSVDGDDVANAVQQLHDNWYGSSSHRDNMLDGAWDDIGIGVHVKDDVIWATVIFRERE